MEILILETNEIISDREFRVRHENQSFPSPLRKEDLEEKGAVAVLEGAQPAAGQYQSVRRKTGAEAIEQDVLGNWVKVYEVVNWTQEEIDAYNTARVPQVVTMRQARLALLQEGLLGSVATAIASLPSPQKEAAEIEWEYSQEVHRNRELVTMLAPALNFTPAQLDDLFILAATL